MTDIFGLTYSALRHFYTSDNIKAVSIERRGPNTKCFPLNRAMPRFEPITEIVVYIVPNLLIFIPRIVKGLEKSGAFEFVKIFKFSETENVSAKVFLLCGF